MILQDNYEYSNELYWIMFEETRFVLLNKFKKSNTQPCNNFLCVALANNFPKFLFLIKNQPAGCWGCATQPICCFLKFVWASGLQWHLTWLIRSRDELPLPSIPHFCKMEQSLLHSQHTWVLFCILKSDLRKCVNTGNVFLEPEVLIKRFVYFWKCYLTCLVNFLGIQPQQNICIWNPTALVSTPSQMRLC